MADSDFGVKARISVDVSDFNKGLSQAQKSATNLSNTFSDVSKIIKKALSMAGIALSTKAIVDFGKSCVESASIAEKQFNILNNVIQTTGANIWTTTNDMVNMAKTLSDSTNYSVTEVEKMQSVLLGFTSITGENFEEASKAVLDMATVMGMDLTSAVQTVGKALDDPINGLDSLRRQGFKFTEEQKEQLKQLVENGNRMEAQKIILDELAVSYGGASQAGQTAFAKITHSIENFQDTLGSELIPFVKEFFDDIAGMINDMMEEIKKIDFTPIHDVLVAIEPLIQSVFGVMLDLLKSILPPLGMIANLLQPVFSILGSAISSVSSAISWFMGTEYDAEKSTSELNKVLSLQADRVNELTNEIRKLTVEQRNAQQASLKSAILAQQSSIEKTKKLMEDLQNEIVDLEDEYNELNQGVSAYFEIEEELGGGGYWDSIQAGIIRTSNGIEEGNEALEETVNNAEKLANMEDNLKEKREKYNKLNEELKVLSAEYESLQAQLKKFGDFEFEEAQRVERERIEAENKAKQAKEDALNDLSKYIDSMNDKELAQKIKLAQQEMDIDIKKAENAGKSEEEIAEIRKNANDKIKGYMLQQIDNEEEAEKKKLEALEAVVGKTKEVEELRTKIHDYYVNERKSLELKFTEIIGQEIEELKRVNYNWDIKLLQLQKDSTKRESEKLSIQEEIYRLQMQMDLAMADEADHAKIIEYYERLIDSLYESKADTLQEINDLQNESTENTKKDYSWTMKLKQQEITRLQTAMDNAVKLAKAEGKSEEEIAKIKEDYLNQIKDKQLDQLKLQKQIDLERATSAEQGYEIDAYYANEQIRLAEETARKIAEAYSAIPSPLAPEKGDTGSKATGGAVADTGDKTSDDKSTELADYFDTLSRLNAEYNEKLKSQKLARIEAERQYDLQALQEQGASAETIFNVNKAYTERLLKLKLEALEEEKQNQLDSIADDENYAELRANIEEYYLNEETTLRKNAYRQIESMRKQDEKNQESGWEKFRKGVASVTSYMTSAFRSAYSAISSMFAKIGNIVSTVWGGFVKALDFNPDETLEGLLVFEDKVLTFFYDILPQLPYFLASAFQSIGTMLNTLFDSMDFDSLFDSLGEAFINALLMLPKIAQKAMPKLLKGIGALAKNLINILPDLLKIGQDLITSVFVKLPSFVSEEIPRLVNGLLSSVKELFRAGSQLVLGIVRELPRLLQSLIDALVSLLDDPTAIADFVVEIVKAISKMVSVLIANLPQLIGAIIPVIAELVSGLIEALPEIVGEVVKGVGSAIGNWASNIGDQVSKGWKKEGLWGATKGFFSSLFGGKAYAFGTNNAQSGLALVGEAGPELVNFRGGEQVLNARNTQKALQASGTTINQNLVFNNLADTTAFTLMQQIRQSNREMALNVVL